MATELRDQEELIAKEVLEEINGRRRKLNQSPISWKDAVKFCMARKFDKQRTMQLYQSHEEVRSRERLLDIHPIGEEITSELLSGKLTILDKRDDSGAAIALFTARFHNPLIPARHFTLQSLVTQLDAALDSLDTQRNGLVFVYDMTDSKFSNFDYDLSVKILDLLKGSYPARLKKVLIVLAPLWFKAPFKILRLFVREKLRDRVYTVDELDICNHIPLNSLPMHLGGTYKVNHLAWLKQCLKVHGYQDSFIQKLFSNAKQPEYVTSKFRNHCATIEAQGLGHGMPNIIGNRENNPTLLSSQKDHKSFPRETPNNHVTVNTRHTTSQHAILAEKPPSGLTRPKEEVINGHGKIVENSIAPQTTPLKPSTLEKSPYESVFPKEIADLLSPEEQLKRAIEHGKNGLISEYMMIKNEPHQDSFQISRLPVNSSKNRYSDVLCYDYTRVVLEQKCPDGSDYINANFVNSFQQYKGYICCQGPLPKTFEDFWNMVWQEKVRTVVMTTKLLEKGRVKCGTYWPQEVNTMETYGQINVMNMESEIDRSEDFQITTLCICNKVTGETRFIKHMLFLQWPDYGIPPSADSFLHFVKSVRDVQAKSVKEMPEWKGHPRGPPIVVHCSAGIGRTGTFICADICIYLLDNVGKLNIRSVVQLIRKQRAFAIQMPDQYVFCHIAVLQYAQQRGLLPPDIDIPKLLDEDF